MYFVNNFLISLLAAGMVAVLFAPLKERLQRGVNRLMYGERDDPYKVLSRLGERLDRTLVPEAVLPTVVRTVREALKLPYVAIALREGGGPSSPLRVELPRINPCGCRSSTRGRRSVSSSWLPAHPARGSPPPIAACSMTSRDRRASPSTLCASRTTFSARASGW